MAEDNQQSVYKGLKVSDKPSSKPGRIISSTRVRRNSAGDTDSCQLYGLQSLVPPGPDPGPGPGHDIMTHSTASESYHDTSVSSVVSQTRDTRHVVQSPEPSSHSQNYHFPSQMNPIRRFTTEADIHHATPLL